MIAATTIEEAIARGVVAAYLLDDRVTSLDRVLALASRWAATTDRWGSPIVDLARRALARVRPTEQIARLMRTGVPYAEAKRCIERGG